MLAAISFGLLLRAAGRRQRAYGMQDPVARRLELASWLTPNPVWTLVDFTLATIVVSPDTPGRVKELIKIVLAIV